jgi:hypothetical protein
MSYFIQPQPFGGGGWPRGLDGPLTIGSGQTVRAYMFHGEGAAAPSSTLGFDGDWCLNIDSGNRYKKVTGAWVLQPGYSSNLYGGLVLDFSSIAIASTGSLQVEHLWFGQPQPPFDATAGNFLNMAPNKWVMIGCRGDASIIGNILYDRYPSIPYLASHAVEVATAPDGYPLSWTFTDLGVGGSGGHGGELSYYTFTAYGGLAGSTGYSNGGGGGGGGAFIGTSPFNGESSNDDPITFIRGGTGGRSGTPFNNGRSYGGYIFGNPGTVSAAVFPYGIGGGGGARGFSGGSLYLKVKGTLSGSGIVSVRGSQGGNGFHGTDGSDSFTTSTSGFDYFGAGGGSGGGSGGNGGKIVVKYGLFSGTLTFPVTLGAGGSKGLAGASLTSGSYNQTDGTDGSAGTVGNNADIGPY